MGSGVVGYVVDTRLLKTPISRKSREMEREGGGGKWEFERERERGEWEMIVNACV